MCMTAVTNISVRTSDARRMYILLAPAAHQLVKKDFDKLSGRGSTLPRRWARLEVREDFDPLELRMLTKSTDCQTLKKPARQGNAGCK